MGNDQSSDAPPATSRANDYAMKCRKECPNPGRFSTIENKRNAEDCNVRCMNKYRNYKTAQRTMGVLPFEGFASMQFHYRRNYSCKRESLAKATVLGGYNQ